MLLRVVV